MSKELRYLVYAMEYYRNVKHLSGFQVAELFSDQGIYQMIEDNYYLYHIESPDLMVTDIDHYIETGEVLDC